MHAPNFKCHRKFKHLHLWHTTLVFSVHPIAFHLPLDTSIEIQSPIVEYPLLSQLVNFIPSFDSAMHIKIEIKLRIVKS